MIKGLFNRLLKNLRGTQYVMLSWFQHLVKSVNYETLNQVQGDKEAVFQQPTKSLKSKCEKLRTPNSKLQRGFTLIEIIIVIVILAIAAAITIKFLVDSLRIYTMTVNQKTLFDEGKLALERMCRDIRDASTIIGTTASSIAFTRTNPTPGGDGAGERIRFDLSGTTLRKAKGVDASGNGGTPYTMADNVTAFTVTYATDEIQLQLTLKLTSGENVTLQTKVYPKNLSPKDVTYKRFYQNWMEVIQ